MQNELSEKIELYLHNELEGEDLRIFEEQLKTDESLRQQLALYKTIDDEMRKIIPGSEEEGKLKETLSGLNKRYFNTPDHSTKVLPLAKRRKWLFAAAAAVLASLAIGYWAFFTGDQGSEALYAEYALHQPISLQRGDSDTAKILEEAIKSYNDKKYILALAGLTYYLQTDSSDAELILAKNICLTEAGNYELAITGFDKLAAENKIFKFQATWYKALVYLKQDSKTECKKILESIPAGADTYSKAKELLREL